MLGYREERLSGVRVDDSVVTSVTFALTESSIAVGEVQITAERIIRREDIRASVLSLNPLRARAVAGAAEDVMRTLQTFPGVVAPGELSSELVVRGSDPNQNLIIMDDIEIFNPFRLYGMISMFNPETAADVTLITGGFPAKYGDRLSAVLEVTNREGDRSSAMKGSFDVSVTNASLVLDGRSPFGADGSYLFSARRTYYDLIIGPIARQKGLVAGDVALPNFSDLQTKFVFDASPVSRIILNGVYSRDGMHLVPGPSRQGADSLVLSDDSRNAVAGVAWHYLPSGSFFSKLGLSWYQNNGTSGLDGEVIDPSQDRGLTGNGIDTSGVRLFNVEQERDFLFKKVSLKEDLSLLTGGQTVEAGAGVDFLTTSVLRTYRPDDRLRAILEENGYPTTYSLDQTKRYGRFNTYVQDRITLPAGVSLQPGLRLDYFGILGKTYLQPRLNGSFMIDPVTELRAAWGIYDQSPGYEKLFDQSILLDLSSPSVGRLAAERADHFVLGVDRWIDDRWQLRVESYYKRFDDVIVFATTPGVSYVTAPIPGEDIRLPSGWTSPATVPIDSMTADPVNGASGRGYGFEVLLEKRRSSSEDRLSGWLGYSLARADKLHAGIETPFRFDQRHTLNIVVDFRLNSWLQMNARWHYGSGFPYTPPVGLRPRIVTVTANGKTQHMLETDAAGNVIFDVDEGTEQNLYSARLPAYHRLDFRLTALAGYWGLDWNFYLDVINVYNRRNILGYRFYVADDLTIGRYELLMLPLFPTVGVSVRF